MKESNPVEDTGLYGVAMDPKVLDTIGKTIRAHYNALVHAPVPQKFLDLLAQLEKEEQQEQEKR